MSLHPSRPWPSLLLPVVLAASASGGLAGPVVAREPRLDPGRLQDPGEAVPLQRLSEELRHGRLVEAQRLAATWKYLHPATGVRPVLRLVQRVHELSRVADRRRHGLLTVVAARGREVALEPEELGRFYRRAAAAILGSDPPPVTLHLVEDLDPGFHGVHFAGQIGVAHSGGAVTARHELVHFLLDLHPARPLLSGASWWLNEGLSEALSRSTDARLDHQPPLREEAPTSLAALFPDQGTWRGDPVQPDVGYLGASLATRMLFGEDPLVDDRVDRFLDRFAGASGSHAERFQRASGRSLEDFEAEWRRRFSAEYSLGAIDALPATATPSAATGWPARAEVLTLALRGQVPQALERLAALYRRADGDVPGWLMDDAIRFSQQVSRRGDPAELEALAKLYRCIPHVGLMVPPAQRDESWGRDVLGRVLAGTPSEKVLVFTTITFHGSPWWPMVEAAWRRVEAEEQAPSWLLARGMYAAIMGRLEPPPDGFEGVHGVLEELAARLPERPRVDPELLRAFREARAAYAFGAGRYAVVEQVVREELASVGPRPRLFLNLGAALFHLERYHEALVAYQQGLFLDPDFPGLRLGLGATLLELGELARAREVLERARAIEVDRDRVLGTLARLAGVEGRADEQARFREEADRLGFDPEAHAVPAEFQVMVYTTLNSVLPSPERAVGEPADPSGDSPGPGTRAPLRPEAEGSR